MTEEGPMKLVCENNKKHVSTKGDFYTPKEWTKIFKNSTSVTGAKVWNTLSPALRNCNSIYAFKTCYQNNIFD